MSRWDHMTDFSTTSRRAAIAGVVWAKGPPRRPVAGATVEILSATGEAGGDKVPTRRDGSFVFIERRGRRPPAGPQKLQATAPGFRPVVGPPFTLPLSGRERIQDLELSWVAVTARVVKHGTAQAIENARVSIVKVARAETARKAVFLDLPAGEHTLEIEDPDLVDLAAAEIVLREAPSDAGTSVPATRIGPGKYSFQARQAGDYTLEIEQPGSTGNAGDSKRELKAGAFKVQLMDAEPEAGGRFVFLDLPAGNYTFEASAGGHTGMRLDLRVDPAGATQSICFPLAEERGS